MNMIPKLASFSLNEIKKNKKQNDIIIRRDYVGNIHIFNLVDIDLLDQLYKDYIQIKNDFCFHEVIIADEPCNFFIDIDTDKLDINTILLELEPEIKKENVIVEVNSDSEKTSYHLKSNSIMFKTLYDLGGFVLKKLPEQKFKGIDYGIYSRSISSLRMYMSVKDLSKRNSRKMLIKDTNYSTELLKKTLLTYNENINNIKLIDGYKHLNQFKSSSKQDWDQHSKIFNKKELEHAEYLWNLFDPKNNEHHLKKISILKNTNIRMFTFVSKFCVVKNNEHSNKTEKDIILNIDSFNAIYRCPFNTTCKGKKIKKNIDITKFI